MLELRNLALGRSGADRTYFHQTQKLPELPGHLILVRAGDVLLRNGQLAYFEPELFPNTELAYLGSDTKFNYFANLDSVDVAGDWVALRNCGASLNDLDAGLATSALALHNWHQTHPVCSRCGGHTESRQHGWARGCPVDNSQHFPRTDPAVILLVTNSADEMLLARQTVWPAKQFSVIAGFVEAGETLEAACAREALEEVGINVTDINYLGSQPWPFPQSLMLAFSARADQAELQPDGTEIEEARWVSRSELRASCESEEIKLPPHTSIARQMIDYWYGQRTPDNWTR